MTSIHAPFTWIPAIAVFSKQPGPNVKIRLPHILLPDAKGRNR